MDTVLVLLVDRSHPEVQHDPLNVSLALRAEDVRQYLGTLLGRDGGYRLYVEGRLFEGCLESEVASRGLDVERGITIEYELDEHSAPDVEAQLEDSVSFLAVVDESPQEVLCCTYGGKLRVYECKDGRVVLKETTGHCKVRGVTSGDGNYIYNSSSEVVCIKTGDVLFKVEGEVICSASSGSTVSAGTHEGECYVFREELQRVHTFEACVSSTSIVGNDVEFVSTDGEMGVFSMTAGTFRTRDAGHNITCSDTKDGLRVFGTSCSGIVVERGSEARFMETNIRFSTKVAVHSSNVVAQAAQRMVSILDIGNSREIRRVTVDGYISGIACVGDLLLVAAGSSIRGYRIHGLSDKS